MNIQHYKQRLLDLENSLSAQIGHEADDGRGEFIESAHVADGAFGKSIVDGEPIEERRLEALPWTPYCLKHEQRLELVASSKTPTL